LVLAVVVVSLLLAIPALICHSVFLCCRPHRCPSVAAAVLSGLTACMLFATVGLWRTAINNYVDNDYFYDDDFESYHNDCGRSTGLIGGAAGLAVLACIFEIIATTKIEPVTDIAIINVPGVTGGNTSVVTTSNNSMMGSYGGQQGGYPGGYPPQQGGGYPPQQQQGGGGGYPSQQQQGGGGGYPPQQQQGGYPQHHQQQGSSYPQQGSGYPPQQQQESGYPSQQQQGSGYPPQQESGGYAPQQQQSSGYAPQQDRGFAPQQGAGSPPQQSLQLDAWAEKPESMA
jgi:hypothetical protein